MAEQGMSGWHGLCCRRMFPPDVSSSSSSSRRGRSLPDDGGPSSRLSTGSSHDLPRCAVYYTRMASAVLFSLLGIARGAGTVLFPGLGMDLTTDIEVGRTIACLIHVDGLSVDMSTGLEPDCRADGSALELERGPQSETLRRACYLGISAAALLGLLWDTAVRTEKRSKFQNETIGCTRQKRLGGEVTVEGEFVRAAIPRLALRNAHV